MSSAAFAAIAASNSAAILAEQQRARWERENCIQQEGKQYCPHNPNDDITGHQIGVAVLFLVVWVGVGGYLAFRQMDTYGDFPIFGWLSFAVFVGPFVYLALS